jgi:FkbM family methyltransferase
MTEARINVLKYFLFRDRNHVSLREMFEFFFDASYHTKAGRFIASIVREGEFNRVNFKGYDRPLYYPTDFSSKSLEQVVVESFYLHNWHYYEVPETKVEADDIVVDCGAAEGLFSFLIHKRCKKIFLIEPVAKFCSSLSRTFGNTQHVEIVPVALSDHEGFATISEHDISSSLSLSGKSEGSVPVTTLDKVFFEKNIPVSYIKIDLEGFDYLALLGARELIVKNQPKIAIATYHKYEHAKQIETYLKSIVPTYNIRTKGIFQESGAPVMLHAWV